MPVTYVFDRDVGPEDWIALPRRFAKGERLERSHDQWGLCRNYMLMGGIATVPCTTGETVETSAGPIEKMFTVPVAFLRDEDGRPVVGDYS